MRLSVTLHVHCLSCPAFSDFFCGGGGGGGVFHCISLLCAVNFGLVSSHYIVCTVFSVPELVPQFHVTGENNNSHTVRAGNHRCTDLMFDE